MPATTPPTNKSYPSVDVKNQHNVAKKERTTTGRRCNRIGRAPETGAEVGRAIKATPPPALTPAARLVADVVWNKMQGATFEDIMHSLCEDISTTTFYFQHPRGEVCGAMTEIVNRTTETNADGVLDAFPEEFSPAIKAVESASEWSISSIDTFCGGLLACTAKKSMPKVDDIVVDVRLDGASTVVVPYDEERFGDLYAAAMAVGTGQMVKSANKQG